MVKQEEETHCKSVALIIGGGSGIGLACVHKFLSAGWRVMFSDLDDSVGNACCQELEAVYGVDCCVFARADVTDLSSLDQLIALLVQKWGRVDVMVNSAGVGATPGLPHMLEEADFEQAIDVNFKGVFRAMKAVVPTMLKQKSGSIVNIASVGGMRPMPYGCDYGASKAGVISLSRSIAQAYASKGIRVNAVSPGWIDTPMVAAVIERKGNDMREKMESDIPIGRLGKSDEVANAVYHVACEASFMSGSNVVLDGGMSS